MTDDEYDKKVLVPLRNHHRETKICFDDCDTVDFSTEEENRIRKTLNAITKNASFREMNVSGIKIPGWLLSEWIHTNQTITRIGLCFDHEKGIQNLADAIQNDSVITSIVIEYMRLPNIAIQILNKAFRQNKGIRSLGIYGFDQDEQVFFEQGIAFNSHLEHVNLFFSDINWSDPSKLQKLKNTFAAHTSVTSLHFQLRGHTQINQPHPIVPGFVLSTKIKKFEFTFKHYLHGYNYDFALVSLLVQTILSMPCLEHLKITFDRLETLPIELSKTLRESQASIQLGFDFDGMWADKDSVHRLIKEISSWEPAPQIEIMELFPWAKFAFDWKMFQDIRLTKLGIIDPTETNFLAIVDELPNWKELETFVLQFLPESEAHRIVVHHGKLASAINNNYSIKNAEIDWAEQYGDVQAEKWIEQSLRRNKILSNVGSQTK